ncbi:MAG: glycosyltransferase [Clostridia bacterium]|nr:glycosyltransferase [Clostridia bacterium]
MVKITVVVPVYNVENFLINCVDSIIAQSFTDYEIILVDDGSTDKSGLICDDLSSKYDFISVIHQENKGLGGARNTGISAANGEFLLLLDSDDYLHPNCLEICFNKAIEHQCDMVTFNQQAVYEDGSTGAIYSCPLPENTLVTGSEIKPLLSFCGACNRLYKTALFSEHNIKFPERLWYEDLRTIPKMLCYTNSVYYYAEQPLYYYLQRSGSIMHTPDLKRITKERIDAVDQIQSYYDQNGFSKEFSKELEFMHIFHGFFLPIREMQSMTSGFAPFADILHKHLLQNVKNPEKNPYLSSLGKKERLLFDLELNRKYTAIRILSFINRLIKKEK